jgi:hypothetical protein
METDVKHQRRLIIVTLLLLGAARAFAADVTGTWKASFDTQIGQQNYTYEFVVKDTTLTGKIQSEMGGASEIQQGKVDGDKISGSADTGMMGSFPFDGTRA